MEDLVSWVALWCQVRSLMALLSGTTAGLPTWASFTRAHCPAPRFLRCPCVPVLWDREEEDWPSTLGASVKCEAWTAPLSVWWGGELIMCSHEGASQVCVLSPPLRASQVV